MKWDKESILEVQRDIEPWAKHPRSQRAMRYLSSVLYSDEEHFILEMIQNADDSNSNSIEFIFEKDRIIIINDGNKFTKNDLKNICDIGISKKKKGKIGFMGIGFKSVFKVCDKPQVISGRYNFVIEDKLIPRFRTDIPSSISFNHKRGAIFVIPLKKKGVSATTLYKKTLEITDRILLFLNSVNKICFHNRIRGKDKSPRTLMRKKEGKNRWILIDSMNDESSAFVVFSQEVKVKPKKLHLEDTDKFGKKSIPFMTKIVVAFGIDNLNVKTEPLFCYLPTQICPELPFIIQADFIPTSGRESIQANNYNLFLLQQFPELISSALLDLKESVKDIFELIPLPYEVPQHESIKRLGFNDLISKLYELLEHESIALTDNCEWVIPKNGLILPTYFNRCISSNDVSYISNELNVIHEVSERGKEILIELKAKEWSMTFMIDLFSKHIKINEKGPEQLLTIYDFAAKEYDNEDDDYPLIQFELLGETPFLLTESNEMIAPKGSNSPRLISQYPKKMNRLFVKKFFSQKDIVFLNPYFQLHGGKNKPDGVVDEIIEKRERVRTFLKEKYDVELHTGPYEIIDKGILPMFSDKNINKVTKKRAIELTNFIRIYLSSWKSEMRSRHSNIKEEDILNDLCNRIRLYGYTRNNGHLKWGYFKPNELYLTLPNNDSDIYKVFKNINCITFLSKEYYNYQIEKSRKHFNWKDFFKEIGVWDTPRIDKKIYDGWEWHWKWFERIWKANEEITDFESPDLIKLVELPEGKDRKRRLVLYKSLMKKRWDNTYKKIKYSEHTWKHYYTWHKEDPEEATWIRELRNSDIIYPENYDISYTPNNVYRLTEINQKILPPETPFKRSSHSFYKEIGIKQKPSFNKIMNYIDILKENPPKEVSLNGIIYVEVMTEIYNYLNEIIDDNELSKKGNLEKLRRRRFIYYPTDTKLWWTPKECIWNDESNNFGNRFAYLNKQYQDNTFPFFKKLKIRRNSNFTHCLYIISKIQKELLKSKSLENHSINLRLQLENVYRRLDELIGAASLSNENLYIRRMKSNNIFLCSDGKFHSIKDGIYFTDDEYLKTIIGKKFKLFWNIKPCVTISRLLSAVSMPCIDEEIKYKISPVDNEEDEIITTIEPV